MTNALFGKGKEAILSAAINLPSDTIKAALIDTALWTPNMATDQFLSAASAAIVGTPVALTGKSVTLGVFDAADTTIVAVPGPTSLEAVLLYKDTGSAATSPLILFDDTGTNIPVTSNGGDILIQWNNGADKIFRF